MLRPWALAALVLLAACQREPDFDERYAQAQKAIASKAAAMDRELEQAAATSAPAVSPSPPR